mmetsp:Transcript_11447/g.31811  ORF Transcript_11447/g.31811 Transcript_11447/m.31811 type:complete len:203 (-) Transcript_11447:689-1297(-)
MCWNGAALVWSDCPRGRCSLSSLPSEGSEFRLELLVLEFQELQGGLLLQVQGLRPVRPLLLSPKLPHRVVQLGLRVPEGILQACYVPPQLHPPRVLLPRPRARRALDLTSDLVPHANVLGVSSGRGLLLPRATGGATGHRVPGERGEGGTDAQDARRQAPDAEPPGVRLLLHCSLSLPVHVSRGARARACAGAALGLEDRLL